MPSPGLSVLMTTYNSELYIREAVNSVMNQSFNDYELIIIDDGSTDHTAGIIKSFNDNRIKFLSHTENIGIAHSRNEALNLSSGTYLSFLDSDDILHPQKFEKQITFLKNNPDFGLVGSNVILIDEKGNETGRWKLDARPEKIPPIMLFRNYFVNSAVLFRKANLEDMRYPVDLDIGEDYVMWWWLLQKSKGFNLHEFLLSYRQHPDSLIHRIAEKREEYDKKVYEIIFTDIGIQLTDKEYKTHFSLKNRETIHSFDQMNKTFNWLQKVIQYSGKSSFLDDKATRSVILNRWLKTCYKARKNPSLFLYGVTKILLNFKFFFYCKWWSKKW